MIFHFLMLTDIFSSFDPAITSYFSNYPITFWFSTIFILILSQSTLWISPNPSLYISIILSIISSQISRTLGNTIKGFQSIISPIFPILIIINLSGLIPYIFRISRHLLFTLTLAFPLWLSLILSSIFYSPSKFLAHLLPSGAPDWLNPFLIIIETIRNSVRPITLSFRLAANIRTGHIVLALIAVYTSTTFFNSIYIFIFIILLQLLYIIFEFGICIIQAYIFCLLLSLYSNDHPHSKLNVLFIFFINYYHIRNHSFSYSILYLTRTKSIGIFSYP